MQKKSNLGQNSYYDPNKNSIVRQRRPKNVLPEEDIRSLLDRGHIARIGTRWDEQPFITPTTYWFDSEKHRIIFHSNFVGRIRANSERHTKMCVEVSEWGSLLPSNDPLELSIQYRSVLVFGEVDLIEDPTETRTVMYNLVAKYFPHLRPGKQLKPITDEQLRITSVYQVNITDWSGKENWVPQATQAEDWPPLPTL